MRSRWKRLLLFSGGGSAPSGLLTSLISYWKLEEASGTRADAVVASGNDLTDNNTVTQNPGKIANAGQFTSANSEWLSHADNASLSTGDIDFTFAAWVYLDATAARATILSKGSGTGNSVVEFVMDYLDTSNRLRFFVGGAGVFSIAVANNLGAVSASTWYFVVGWHDSVANTVNIQVNNGTVDSTSTGVQTPPDSTGAFVMGVLTTNSAQYWNGRIDEVGFWKRTLTATEKTNLYNGGTGVTYPFTGVP